MSRRRVDVPALVVWMVAGWMIAGAIVVPPLVALGLFSVMREARP